MRTLSVVGAGDGVEQAFRDVGLLAERCRYTNCSHGGEQGCAVAAAVSAGHLERGRFEAWRRLNAEPALSEPEITRRSIAARKQRKADVRIARRDGKS
jgi:ribosome biogenesis GTPase